ncbi:TPA: phage tail protein, partial [Providencia alcalifaciens]
MKYYALLTTYGEKVLAEATALGTKIELTHMSVGDGGGSLPAPDTKQTKLINERRKAAINTLFIDPLNPNQIIAEQVIPENEGGWWIREIGLFDKSGALVAIANCPETYKPLLVEGSGRTQTIRVVLIVNHTESVTLKIDPTVVLATRKYVDDAIEVLDKKIKELTAKDVGAVPTTDVVQSTGQSATQVMSQKASTTAIADAKKAGTDAQATANSAASAASSAASAASNANSNANDRLPKTDVVQGTGQSTTQVMSQKASTTAIADAKKAGTDAQNTANSAASAASSANENANNRLLKTDVVQSTGQSKVQVMSQEASTKAFMQFGDFGFGGNAINVPASTGYDGITQTSVLKGSGVSGTPPGDIAWGSILHLQRDTGRAAQLGFWQGNIATRSQKDGVWEEKWSFSYTEANTEKDSQGFLKEKGNKKTVVITDNIAHTAGDDKAKVMSQWGAKDCFMQFGDFGLGGNARSLANLYPNGDFTPSMFDSLKTGFYSFGGERNAPIPNNYNHFIYVRWNDNAAAVLGFTAEGHAYLYGRNGTWRERIDIYTSKTAPKNTASKSSNSGWWKCANTGLIYQFASGSSSKTGDLIQFPIAFPSACIALNISDDNGSNAVGVTGRNTSGFNIRYSQES